MDLYDEESDHRLDVEQLEDVQDAADVVAVLLAARSEQWPTGPVWLDSSPALGPQRMPAALGMVKVGGVSRRTPANTCACSWSAMSSAWLTSRCGRR